MPRPSQEKCRLCSKLSTAEAQLKHGSTGDNCWDPSRCHDRRSYYRHRSIKNYNRKQRRHLLQQVVLSEPTANHNVITLDIPVPAIPAAIPAFLTNFGSIIAQSLVKQRIDPDQSEAKKTTLC